MARHPEVAAAYAAASLAAAPACAWAGVALVRTGRTVRRVRGAPRVPPERNKR